MFKNVKNPKDLLYTSLMLGMLGIGLLVFGEGYIGISVFLLALGIIGIIGAVRGLIQKGKQVLEHVEWQVGQANEGKKVKSFWQIGRETPTKKAIKNELIISSIILVIGLVVVAIGINNNIERQRKLEYYINTQATVIEHRENDDGEKAIVVEYEVKGQKFKLSSSFYSKNVKRIGTIINVKYNPDNYADAIFVTDSGQYQLIIGGLVFIVFAVFGLINAFINMKKRKKEDMENASNVLKTTP